AVVGFAGRAYVALPPTDDRALALTALRSLHTAEGTSLGDAIGLATQLARRQRTADGTIPPAAIVVISDGANLSGRTSPATAALHARSSHIPIYSILVGTENGVITVPLANGAAVVLAAPVAGVMPAAATNECRGLQVCVRVPGPWVVVPSSRSPVQYQLSCPRGFVVGGLDAELSDRAVDIDFLGLLGSP